MRTAGILFAGITTTFFTLLFVLGLRQNVDFMGFYISLFLPIGSIFVGLLAASGYLLVIHSTKAPISPRLHGAIFAIQIFFYFFIDFLTFKYKHLVHRNDGSPVGYWEYFDLSARSMSLQHTLSTNPTNSLGLFGYFFILLKIAGFSGVLFFANPTLDKSEICENCKTYFESKFVGTLSANEKDLEKSQDLLNRIQDALESGDTDILYEEIVNNSISEEEAKGRLNLVRLRLRWCPTCYSGTFRAKEVGVNGETLIDEELPPDQMVTLAVQKWTR